MFFDVEDGSDSTDVVSTGDVSQMSGLILNPGYDFVLFQIVLDGVSLIDFWVSESDSPGIVGDDVWDFVWSNCLGLDFEQFKFSFSIFDFKESESSFNIIKKSVVFVSLDDGEYVHDSDWEFNISSDFIINFNASFFVLNNDVSFATSEGQSESMPEC